MWQGIDGERYGLAASILMDALCGSHKRGVGISEAFFTYSFTGNIGDREGIREK